MHGVKTNRMVKQSFYTCLQGDSSLAWQWDSNLDFSCMVIGHKISINNNFQKRKVWERRSQHIRVLSEAWIRMKMTHNSL